MAVTVTAADTSLQFIAAVNAASGNYTGITVGASDTALLLLIQWSAAVSGVSVTWDSGGTNQVMTLIADLTPTGTGLTAHKLQLWGRLNPTAGAKTAAVAWTTSARCMGVGISFKGSETSSIAACFTGLRTVDTNTAETALVIPSGDTLNDVFVGQITAVGGTISAPTATSMGLTNNSSDVGLPICASYTTATYFGQVGATLAVANVWAGHGIIVTAPASIQGRPTYRIFQPSRRRDQGLGRSLRSFDFPPDAGIQFETDWSLPVAPLYPPQLRTHINPVNLNLIGQDTFFGDPGCGPDYDWPLPRTPPRPDLTYTDSMQPGLVDTFFGLAGAPNFDWPVPQTPVYHVQLRTHLESFQPGIADTFYGLGGAPNFDWPVPQTPVYHVQFRTHLDHTKLNLRGQDALPTRQQDWPLPKTPPRPDLTWVQPGNNFLVVIYPFNQYDWPVSRSAEVSFPAQLRTHTASRQQGLVDTFFGLAGNPNYDWPLPKVPPRPDLTWLQSEVTFLTVVYPFNQTNWPLPTTSAYHVQLRTHTDTYKSQMFVDTFFGLAGHPNYDWPLPRVAPRPDFTWTQFGPNFLTVVVPFNQTDWPVPRTSVYMNQLRTHLSSANLGTDTFFGLAGAPNFDWPLAKVPTRLDCTWVQGLSAPLQTTIQLRVPTQYTIRSAPRLPDYTWLQGFNPNYLSALPLNQYDWPIPRAQVHHIQLRTHLNIRQQGLTDTFFGLGGAPNFDWPNPRAPTYHVQLRTHLNIRQQGLADTFFGLAGNPNFDWPLPKTPPRPNFGFTRGDPNYIVVAFPRNQYDWPIPRGALYPAQMRTHTDKYFPGLIGKDKLPFQNYDWPNPRAPVYTISLRVLINTTPSAIPLPPIPPGNFRLPLFLNEGMTGVAATNFWGGRRRDDG